MATTKIDRVEALCCTCGEPRTVHRHYYGPMQRRGPSQDDLATGSRNLRVLKCAACGEWTMHAVVGVAP
jgi:hypothetical protein